MGCCISNTLAGPVLVDEQCSGRAALSNPAKACVLAIDYWCGTDRGGLVVSLYSVNAIRTDHYAVCVSVADRNDHGIFPGFFCCCSRVFYCLYVRFPVAHCLVVPGSLLGSTL